MTEKEFQTCFFQWRIPKDLRPILMKEMEKYGLLKIEKKLRKRKVFLNNYEFSENHIRPEYKDGDTKVEQPYVSYDKLLI